MIEHHSGRISCPVVRDYLDSYLNDELLVETNHLVLSHLRRCAACKSVLTDRTRIKSILKNAVSSQQPSDGLHERVRARIRRPLIAAGNWLTLATAGALMVTVYLAVPAPWWHASAPAEPPITTSRADATDLVAGSIFQIGLDEHVKCAIDDGFANQTFDEDAIRRELGPQYQGLLAVVKDAIPAGYVITAGHRCSYRERPFVHLILRGPEGAVSLLITPRQGQSFGGDAEPAVYDPRLHERTAEGASVAAFETNDYFAFLISSLAPERNRLIAATVAPGIRRFLS